MQTLDQVEPSHEAAEKYYPRAGRAIGWLLLMAAVGALAALLFFFCYGVFMAAAQPELSPADIEAMISSQAYNPDVLAGVYVTQFVFLLPIIFWAANFTYQRWDKTLAFTRVTGRQLGLWLGIWAVYQLLAGVMHTLVDVPADAFTQAMGERFHWPMFLVIVLLAPLLEELIFRGYMFKALRHSWLGLAGTLLVTSVLFVLLHVGQYNLWLLIQLAVFSVILGLARERTESIFTPWLLHTVNNLVSYIALLFLGASL